MTFRSRVLLDLAHTMPCMAKFPHNCVGYQGCEPAHSDSQLFGRGHGHKSPDWAWAAMCHNAHKILSAIVGPMFNREEKQSEWMRAYIATQNWLWENGKLRVVS